MVWAHIMSKSSVMGNPYEYQEIMQAAFQFGTTETVDEVVVRHKAKHDEEERERDRVRNRPGRTGGGASPFAQRSPNAAPELTAKPKQTEMDKVRAMLAAGTVRTKPLVDPDAE